jgi:DNA-binding NarL/FixJ family response regulator
VTIRVLVVDDEELVRTGLRLILDSEPDIGVVGTASDGRQAVAEVRRLCPDVVLMDIRMPVMDGIEATAAMAARQDPPKVIVLTTFDVDEHAFAALQAGASGFLVKDAPAEDLLSAIRTVHRGDAVISPTTTRRLLAEVAPDLPTPVSGPDPLAALTDREREVLLLIARGASNAAVAKELFLSEGTVKTHVGRLLSKLGMRDRVQLVIFAYEHRLVRPGR